MKILVITECYPSARQPQYGVFIKQQLDELRKLGNIADVIVPKRNSLKSELEFVQDEIENRYVLSYQTDRYELLLRHCAKVLVNNIISAINIQEYSVIAVHIASDTVLAAAVMTGEKFGIAVVQHYHGLNVWKNHIERHPVRAEGYAIRRVSLLKKCAAIIGVSNKVCMIVRQRLDSENIYTVYNGVDSKLFKPISSKTEKGGKLKIVSVANLIPIKGLNYLIDAFARLYNDNPQATLEIIGEGILCSELATQARRIGVEGAITFSGRLSYEDVATHMRNSNMFVLPSFYEAIGCVYLEAMSCGIPVIGIVSMGISEIIVDGYNGLLAEPQNVESLYNKIKILANDKELAERIGTAGSITAQQYTWEASASNLNKVYHTYAMR